MNPVNMIPIINEWDAALWERKYEFRIFWRGARKISKSGKNDISQRKIIVSGGTYPKKGMSIKIPINIWVKKSIKFRL